MRVYAETNFVLEMVFEQGEVADAEALVALAGLRLVDLVVPAAALFETSETVHRRVADRRELARRVEQELVQVGRSLSLEQEASDVRGTLVRAATLVTERHRAVREQLMGAVRWVPLDENVLKAALQVEAERGLEPPDAVMLASVLADAGEQGVESLFVSKNPEDFDTPDIRAALRALGCEMVFSIHAAHERARAALRRAAPS